jgi:hypothetical protein
MEEAIAQGCDQAAEKYRNAAEDARAGDTDNRLKQELEAKAYEEQEKAQHPTVPGPEDHRQAMAVFDSAANDIQTIANQFGLVPNPPPAGQVYDYYAAYTQNGNWYSDRN